MRECRIEHLKYRQQDMVLRPIFLQSAELFGGGLAGRLRFLQLMVGFLDLFVQLAALTFQVVAVLGNN